MFIKEFIRDWKTVGAIAPSSKGLARKVVEQAGVATAHRILEVGAGTGSFTEAIREKLGTSAFYIGAELNPVFVEALKQRFPDLQFQAGDIVDMDLAGLCASKGGRFEAIVSGLPWTAFSQGLQERILDHVLPHLAPGGRFVTFAYTGFHWLPAGQRFRALLKSRLKKVTTTSTVWMNLPPAFVYVGEA